MTLGTKHTSDALRNASSDTRRTGIGFIENQFVPIADAKISVLDWGLLHSDATYDVVHVWKGRFFRLNDHLARFAQSLHQLRLSPGRSIEDVASVLETCVRLSGLRDAYVEMACTRGIPEPGSRDPRDCRNRFFAFATPFVWVTPPDREPEGLRLKIGRQTRIPPDSIDPRIKNYHWLDFTMGLFDAYDAGAESVVLPDRHGNLCEGPGFNIFIVRAGKIITPSDGVLEGITRRTVFELADELNIGIEERPVPIAEAQLSDEVFISSTAGGIMSVRELDGRLLHKGNTGPITEELRQLYWMKKEAGWHGHPVSYS